MSGQSHERPEFYNSVTYAVAITITVEGGKRQGTADRRAKRVAERLANAAARTPGVVDVTATAGRDFNGEVHWPERVLFAEANSGHGTHADRDKLDRYLDPEHERALRSLADENAAAEQRRQADRDRRRSAGCNNTYAFSGSDRRHCECVYCQPGDHYLAARHADEHGPSPFCTYRCVCGVPVAAAGERCLHHRGAEIVVLDGDRDALRALADQQRREPTQGIVPCDDRGQELEL